MQLILLMASNLSICSPPFNWRTVTHFLECGVSNLEVFESLDSSPTFRTWFCLHRSAVWRNFHSIADNSRLYTRVLYIAGPRRSLIDRAVDVAAWYASRRQNMQELSACVTWFVSIWLCRAISSETIQCARIVRDLVVHWTVSIVSVFFHFFFLVSVFDRIQTTLMSRHRNASCAGVYNVTPWSLQFRPRRSPF